MRATRMAVTHRVIMNVIAKLDKCRLVADLMLPHAPLPNPALTLVLFRWAASRFATATAQILPRRPRFDQSPTRREIRITRGHCHDAMQMIGQQNDSIYNERPVAPCQFDGIMQRIAHRWCGQDRPPTIGNEGKEERATRCKCARIIRHISRLTKSGDEIEIATRSSPMVFRWVEYNPPYPLIYTIDIDNRVVQSSNTAPQRPSVGINPCSQLMFAASVIDEAMSAAFDDDSVVIQRVDADGTAPLAGSFHALTEEHTFPVQPRGPVVYTFPSLAIAEDGRVRASWLGNCDQCRLGSDVFNVTNTAMLVDFDFFTNPGAQTTPLAMNPPTDTGPSSGARLGSTAIGRLTFGDDDNGVQEGLLPGTTTVFSPCAIECYEDFWQPSMAMRSNGEFVVAWAEPENPTQLDSRFNIALGTYSESGTLVDQLTGPTDIDWVNEPALELSPSNQLSPAVAFDDYGNIVVTWVGPDEGGAARVFARRFSWSGVGNDIVAESPSFLVSNDLSCGNGGPANLSAANPTVALTQQSPSDPAPVGEPFVRQPGRFVIAWNREDASGNRNEIQGQYFYEDGRPMGGLFRVNQAISATGETPSGATINSRQLGESNQHTLVYGKQEQVVAAWTTDGGFTDDSLNHFTLLPAGYGLYLDTLQTCCKADTNYDGLRDGRDIQGFVDLLMNKECIVNY